MTMTSIRLNANKEFIVSNRKPFNDEVVKSFSDLIMDAMTETAESSFTKSVRISGKSMKLAMGIVDHSAKGTLRGSWDDKK